MDNTIPIFALIPFVLMLGSIAVFPLVAGRFWENNRNQLLVALVLGAPTAAWLLAVGHGAVLYHEMVFGYVPFLVLLGSLFIITGGIFVDGDLEAKPSVNTVFLALGAVLASFLGTTGAAMLLIRPLLHTNRTRKLKVHTILFFIAIVANCGGLMTPLGDPPLFMMYLRGVDFFWFFGLAPEWLFVNGMLLIIYFAADSYYWRNESPEVRFREHKYTKKIRIEGKFNFVWLAGVMLAVAVINENNFELLRQNEYYNFLREIVILLMAYCSLKFTPHMTRVSNSFTWHPILEVAYLFFGIFITMVPCILFLEANAARIGMATPGEFYYTAGFLSSFLDNTPTAITFYSLAEGLVRQAPQLLNGFERVAGIPASLMKAISVGAVFFGAMTYIGNGPNFMIKSIAESNNIKMPHFFSYMLRFSLLVLLPIFILCELLFIE